MKFKKSSEIEIALQCQKCKNIDTYPTSMFKSSWLKTYLKKGFIPQSCCGEGEYDGLSNTPHKIIGYIEEKHVPVKDMTLLKKLYGIS